MFLSKTITRNQGPRQSIKMLSNFPMLFHEVMVKLGLSNDDVGELTGLHPTTIHGYLKGKFQPSKQTLMKLCAALDVSPEHFCGSYFLNGKFQDRPRKARRKNRKNKGVTRKPAKVMAMTRTPDPVADNGDWRLLEVSTNQISKTTLIHHDPNTNTIILRLED